ncbi:conserved hypothetical protein [Pseudomonas sp. IT-232MI5]
MANARDGKTRQCYEMSVSALLVIFSRYLLIVMSAQGVLISSGQYSVTCKNIYCQSLN